MLTIRQIRALLYDEGYTIGGARQRMTDEQSKGVHPTQIAAVIQETIDDLEELLELLKPGK